MESLSSIKSDLTLTTSRHSSKNQLKKVLIVGWNVEAVSLYEMLMSTPSLGYDVVGFIKPSGFQGGSFYKNVPVVGDSGNILDKVQQLDIQKILILLSPAEKFALGQVISVCLKNGIPYKIVSESTDDGIDHLIRHVISDVLKPQDISFRKVFDLCASMFLMIILFPLFIIVSIIIKLESNGPIFYSQERYGKDRKSFRVIKFRSMVQDAEEKSGPVWATKSDPRITKFGQFMRKTRIDELPQLINILRGEMSFIGPRPERPFFSDEFKKQIPFYMNRLKAKPGITGLAQVTVGYDETIEDVKNKVLKDLEYIEHSNSLKMNLNICWQTVGSVLRGEGQ